VDDASEFLACVLARPPFVSLDQSILPVTASTQTSIRLAPSSLAVWRKTLPLDTIGDEFPFPGIGVFQT
jgi:hypothetical protein